MSVYVIPPLALLVIYFLFNMTDSNENTKDAYYLILLQTRGTPADGNVFNIIYIKHLCATILCITLL